MALKQFDDSFRVNGTELICGTDEAGRGPLAGPVVAAAVLLSREINLPGVNDSKKLTEKKREALLETIQQQSVAWSYDIQSETEIDALNILQASLKAMRKSIEKLVPQPQLILVDGNKIFPSLIPIQSVVKGDAKSLAIASASIIAKVIRDRIMMELHDEFPMYGWDKNKAYPTAEHIKAILTFGPCKYHRKSFLKNMTAWQQKSLFD